MLEVYPLIPENSFPYCSSNLSYIRDTYFLYSVTLLYLLLLLYQQPKNTFLHNTRILSCHLELYLAFLL